MSYKSKGCRTEIKVEKHQALALNIDEDNDGNKLPGLHVRVPLGGNTVTYHLFRLTREETIAMSDWFNQFLKDKRFKPKKLLKKSLKKITKKKKGGR